VDVRASVAENWKKCGGMEVFWAKMIIFAD
jgi:hypothetical protein